MKGSRIQSIVRELNGEKIDIINWSDQPEILISRSLSPAKPRDLYIDEDNLYALVVFEDDEINQAIGREGINIKLSNAVTGFRIEAIKASEYDRSKSINIDDINMSEKYKKLLLSNDITTTKEFFEAEKDHILSFKGLGEKTYMNIEEHIKEEISKI